MNLFRKFFGGVDSATVARDRLKILLSHERASDEGDADLIAQLQEDILAAISKRISVDRDKVKIEMDREEGCAILGIDIELPNKGVISTGTGGNKRHAA